MQPLNKRERVAAFLWFLLFYVVTTTLIITAVFLNYQVPVQENKDLLKEVQKWRKDFEQQQAIHLKFNSIKGNLDIVNAPEQNAGYIDQVVTGALVDIRNHIPKESSYFSFYDNIIQVFLSLQQSKQQLRNLLRAQEEIISLKEKLQLLNDQLEIKSRDLDNCRQMLLLHSRSN